MARPPGRRSHRRRDASRSTGAALTGAAGALAALLGALAVALLLEPSRQRLRHILSEASSPSRPVGRRRNGRRATRPFPVAGRTALACDLVAAALVAGSPLSHAFAATGAAMAPDGRDADLVGRCADDISVALTMVARAMALGAGSEQALALLEQPPQPSGRRPAESSRRIRDPERAERARLAGVVLRASSSGARLADQLTLLADDLRTEEAAAALVRARRAGVLAVLPLGGCFLPAFMLLAVVPTVAGLVASLTA